LKIPVGEVDGPEKDDASRPEVGQLRERLFIKHGPTVIEPCRQLEPRPAIAAREPRRRTAPGLESQAGVVPFQKVWGRLASRRGRREGVN